MSERNMLRSVQVVILLLGTIKRNDNVLLKPTYRCPIKHQKQIANNSEETDMIKCLTRKKKADQRKHN